MLSNGSYKGEKISVGVNHLALREHRTHFSKSPDERGSDFDGDGKGTKKVMHEMTVED